MLKRNSLFLCLLTLLLLIPDLCQAAIFTPPPTDKSVDFLGHIFGPHIGSVYLGGMANPTLQHMFQMFNTVIISLGGIIISYVGVISTINTAQEGHVLGKKFSSIWIPMRSTLGMLLLVPTPNSGYSIIQTTVMWIIMQGIGAADQIWNAVLRDLGAGISVTKGIVKPMQRSPSKQTFQTLELQGSLLAEATLYSQVCLQSIYKMLGEQGPGQRFFPWDPKLSHVQQHGPNVRMYEVPNSYGNYANEQGARYGGQLHIGVVGHPEHGHICGRYIMSGEVKRTEWDPNLYITPKDMERKAREIYAHKLEALQLMIHSYKPLADLIVAESPHLRPRDGNNRLVLNSGEILTHRFQPIVGYKEQATQAYVENMTKMVKPQPNLSVMDMIHQGMRHGWISAGSFYFTLNQTKDVSFYADVVTPPDAYDIPKCNNTAYCRDFVPEHINVLNPKLSHFVQNSEEKNFMSRVLYDAEVYFKNDNYLTPKNDRLPGNPNIKRQDHELFAMQEKILNDLHQMMHEQDQDPLLAQGKFGVSLMLAAEHAAFEPQAELQALVNRAEQGYNEITNKFTDRIKELQHKSSMALIIFGIIWVVGATLAIYIPLIPYMVFTVGAIGWMLLVIEAIVAAPILSIGFMLPSGDEMGKVAQGLMLLLNIVLRPVLMLFGFVLAARLYQVAVRFINWGMLSNFSYIDSYSSLYAWAAVITLYGTFVVTLANKCFSLIYAIPDKVLRWMGGAPEYNDPSQELGQAKNAMLKAANDTVNVTGSLPERGLTRLQDRARQLLPPTKSPGDEVRGGASKM